MDSPNEKPVPPTNPGLSWRSLQPADVEALSALATACLAADGGHILGAAETYLQEHYFSTQPRVSIGAFEMDGRLVACAAAHPTHTPQEHRATIVGQVHPDCRRRGFGTFLVKWSIAEASNVLAAHPLDRPCVLQITTEMLTEAAARLFELHGFALQFAEDVMRCDLHAPLPEVMLPSVIKFTTWSPALVDQFFAVYQAAFRDRPGFPDWSQEKWLAWVAPDDDDFRPKMSLLADHDDLRVGFIVCAENWIVQMGVRPERRGQGIGAALLMEVLRRFRAAGEDHVLLDVNVNNPRAASVYSRLGFERAGRRARYERALT